jgi:membrane protein YqaA with SNARE-associated domain
VLTNLSSWLTTLGPYGLLLLSFLDSAMIPMPQGVDALLIAQAIAEPSSGYFGAGLATLGSLAGSLVLYSVARRGGRAVLERKASTAGVDKIRRQIEKFDALVLLPGTMIPLPPLPMKPFVMAAGVFEMKLLRFISVILFARIVRYFGEAYIAIRYREETTAFLKEHALTSVLLGVVLIVVFYGVHRWATRRMTAAD